MLAQDKYELTEVSSCQSQKQKRDNVLSQRFSWCLILLPASVQTVTFFNEEMVRKDAKMKNEIYIQLVVVLLACHFRSAGKLWKARHL